MSAAKVLIVDDSITMRALFTSALEQSKELTVVGAASGADEAREMIRALRPDVLTLDVEMPGMSGIEFLAELMESSKPIPVVMLSTLTQKGSDIALKAIEIGAVDCFPKPTKATPDEFEKISGKLCKLVATAAKTNVRARLAARRAAAVQHSATGYDWDGTVVAISAGMGGVEAIGQMLASYPENCPPTIVVHPMEEGLSVPFAAKLNAAIRPTVKIANQDGLPLEPGVVYLAADMNRHVAIDRWPNGRVRLVERDPVSGCRPSADLLFSTVAKTLGPQGRAVVLSGGGVDGAGGLVRVRQAGGATYCQDAATSLIHEVADLALAHNGVEQQLPPAELGIAVLQPRDGALAA